MSPLGRTHSAASISSTMSNVSTGSATNSSRRTRKRFSDVQLAALENLFHRTTHPTRQERELIASEVGLYVSQNHSHQSFSLNRFVREGTRNQSRYGSKTNAKRKEKSHRQNTAAVRICRTHRHRCYRDLPLTSSLHVRNSVRYTKSHVDTI